MNSFKLLVITAAMSVALAGCLGFGADDALERTSVEPTGRTVELNMWVEDWEQPIWEGFTGAFWAFCVEPANPESADAVEYVNGDKPCSVPAPTIRVNQGDRVVVNFKNPHQFPHTVHWHGQTVPNRMDGVPGSTQAPVEQDGNYTYEFIAEREGTLMYHCHVDTQHHVFMGLYGAFIVNPQNTEFEPDTDRDYTLVLSHANRSMMDAKAGGHHGGGGGGGHGGHGGGGGHGGHSSGTPGQQNGPFNPEFDIFMINGKSFPLTLESPSSYLKVNEGEKVRLRLLNIGYLPESIHLHGHDMLVTHKDGLPLESPYWADTVAISPGERYDVVVTADNPGKWVIHTHVPTHVSNDHQYPGGMLTQMVYDGYENQTFPVAKPGGQPGGMQMDHSQHKEPARPDYTRQETGEVTGVDYAQSYDFPVETVEAYKVQLMLELAAGSQLDELTLTLNDAEGNEVRSVTVNSGAPRAGITLREIPNAGTYNATVTGQGVQGSYTLDFLVQYQQPEPAGDGHAHQH